MTPRDLLEAITGEWLAATRHDAAWATPRDDGSWLLDGTMPITEFKSRLDIHDDLPEEERGRYNTLAGLILFLLGHLPQRGERVECQGWQLEVQTLEGRRIDQVLARPIPIALS
jgi:putative hemolysin